MECNSHNRVLLREELLNVVRGKDGILSLLTDTMDGEVMDSAGESLKMIANYAVGFNNIDVSATTKRKIAVSNTPGVLTDTTADLAMALILAVARRIVESDVYTRAGKYMGWDPLLFMGSDVHHKTLGILGFGRVGQALAKRAAGFDMQILYHNRRQVNPEIEKMLSATYVDQGTLLKTSDFLSIHVPSTPETTGLIGSKALSLMKHSAFVINTARGELIREAALSAGVDALVTGNTRHFPEKSLHGPYGAPRLLNFCKCSPSPFQHPDLLCGYCSLVSHPI